MRTVNTSYINKKLLIDFCIQNDIPDSDKVLLQIFTASLDETYIDNIIESVTDLLPRINIIGSTTDGEIIDKEIKSSSTVLSFSIFEDTNIAVHKIKKHPSSYQTGKHLVKKIQNIDDAKAAIVFADGLNTNGEVFLKAFNKYAPKIEVAGGLAADNATFTKTHVFTKDGLDDSGAVAAILYNPDLIVNTAYSFGWEEIGKEMTVTKSIENCVYSIDGITPTDIYKKYLGQEIEEQLPATGIEFPIIIKRNGKKIARAVIGKNDDGSLLFAGNIKKGDKVRLGYGNIEDILNSRFNLYEEISNIPFESIFVYSCMARKRLLEDEIKEEILPMSKAAPLSGFFTYGEFYYSHEESSCSNNLLNQTMTVLTLSEKSTKRTPIDDKRVENKRNVQTIKALSRLISETSRELNDFNKNLQKKVDLEVQKNMQHELRMLEQTKLASMGEMIGNIAHQWRQPLSVISTAASGIQIHKELGILKDELLDHTLVEIENSAQYLSKTIDTFRDFIKEEKVIKEVVLQESIRKALEIVQTALKNNHIKLINNIDKIEPLKMKLVVGELSQVIINIINNAKDAIKETTIEQPWVKIELEKKEDKIIVNIEDNGGGIPEDILPKIFEPYFTTKHQSQGTGLGLHMSYKIITESLKGRLYAQNTIEGVKFFIELPL